MSSDWLGGIAAVLWVISGLAALVASGVALGAWQAARGENKVKDAEARRVANDFTKYKQESSERISANEAETAEAKREAAEFKEKSAQAELKLARLMREVAPRYIPRDKFLNAIANQPTSRVEIMYLRDDPECLDVANQIWRLLQDAKWDVIHPVPIPATTSDSDLGAPASMSVDAQPSGVTIAANSMSEQELNAFTQMTGDRHPARTPLIALQYAFEESLGKIGVWAGGPHRPPVGTLRVVVAPRTGASQGP